MLLLKKAVGRWSCQRTTKGGYRFLFATFCRLASWRVHPAGCRRKPDRLGFQLKWFEASAGYLAIRSRDRIGCSFQPFFTRPSTVTLIIILSNCAERHKRKTAYSRTSISAYRLNLKRQPARASSKPPAKLMVEMVRAASNQNFSGNRRMRVSEVLKDQVPGAKKTW